MGNKITEEDVYAVLSEVYDPEIPINIVDLGLIYNICIDKSNNIDVEMTMTVRGCPMHAVITQQAKKKLEELKGVGNVNLKLVWDPPWTPERISKEVKKKLQKGE